MPNFFNPDSSEGTPLDIPVDLLPENFREGAVGAVGALARTIATNEGRALAGHPPVPCQLTGPQAEALAAMVWGLNFLYVTRDQRGKKA